MEITYDEFKKMDLRVARVLKAERIPDTDKLIKFELAAGDEESRCIVSGIAEFFSPDDLVGKEIVIIANLEPRMIRGVESRGMLLAVRDGDALALLTPSIEVAAGAQVG